jgi:hypothetical protein
MRLIKVRWSNWGKIGKLMAWATFAALAVPGIADACSNTSGNGTWDVYSTAITGSPGWNRCSGRVTNGDISGSCVTDTGAANTVRGTLRAAANCRVSGSLIHTFAGGARYTVTIAQATLGAAEDVIMGVGRSSTGQAITFQGVRR